MHDSRAPLAEALASFDRTAIQGHVQQGIQERKQALERFPPEVWERMPLDQYALGQENSDETFCRWMEFRTPHIGSIRGGSSLKLLIFKRKNKPGWYFDSDYRDEQEAWLKVRGAFAEAIEKARAGDWDTIDDLVPIYGGPAIRLKTLQLYFPDELLPIFSTSHLRHFLELLGRSEAKDKALGVVQLNRALLAAARELSGFDGFSNAEIERFLYQWGDPRDERRVVKIAPGEEAKYWDECLREGYICVGWDAVGDLSEFESKESFRAHFEKVFAADYHGHKPTLTRKAKEVWTLMELEAGDLVVANKGIAQVLAVGVVEEPGYEWRPERPEYKHTVKINWDTSYAKAIPAEKKWALTTVAPVGSELYKVIVSKTGGPPVVEPPPPPVEPLFRGIAEALERKGQVILYGPPGTGKTYHARRFAVWWLLQGQGRSNDAQAALGDGQKFREAEKALSAAQAQRRVWWVVANPSQWNWDRLFRDKRVEYKYGRLQRNYPHVKPGDLVVGYQSTPDKRIVALATVTRGLEEPEGGEPSIELAPVARIKNGLTYDELAADEILKRSEPMRFRNQGTLFAVTADEAEHLFSVLSERNPDLQPHVEGDENVVSPLTRVTFHPSYSYEDFVEGFRPHDTGDGALSLRLADGVFKRLCHAALAQPQKRFLLLVDEINRANVAKVLGELITLLERDKRGMPVTLPQSKEAFSIPPNVFILGTMNTADRSIKLLDAALRRRFAFLEIMPDIEVLRGAKVGPLALDEFLEQLNRRIARTEGREKQIGHSFLLDDGVPVSDPDELLRRFRQEILPLLQEYCYDDYSALAAYIGPKLVDKDSQTLDQELLGDADDLLEVLAEELGRREGPKA